MTPPVTPAPSNLAVSKDAFPTSRPEPGGIFTFAVGVTNLGSQPVIVLSLIDSVYGNLHGLGNCTTGALLPPDSTYICQFNVVFAGVAGASETNIVTASTVDAAGNVSSAQDDARISITAPVTPAVRPHSPPVAGLSPSPSPPPTVATTSATPAGPAVKPDATGTGILARTGTDALALAAFAAALIVSGCQMRAKKPAFNSNGSAGRRNR